MKIKPNSFTKQTVSENPFQAKWAVLAGTSRKRSTKASISTGPRHRRNVFVDRRIAEDDPSLPEDDRYLARLQRERTRRNRKRARFSLADTDDVDDGSAQTQPPGLSLLRDDYDDAEDADRDEDGDGAKGAGDDSDDDEFLTLKKSDANGEESDEDDRERTHQEIMDEVVLKSKMHKAQRQQEKHTVDEETAKLDKDLPDIMAMLAKSGNDFARRKAEKKSILNPSPKPIFTDEGEEEQATVAKLLPPAGDNRTFHYERIYQQLAAEKCARPSNRLLTEEEKAQKEMEELVELEEKRKRRMQNAESEDEQDDDGRELGRRKNSRQKDKKGKKAGSRTGGDDLDDGFDLPETSGDSDVEDSDTSDPAESLGEDPRPTANSERGRNDLKSRNSLSSEPRMFDSNMMVFPNPFFAKIQHSDIPYVFKECPSKTAQLQTLFEDKTINQRSLVLERLRKCFAVSLNTTANPAKLDGLLQCLLQRIEILTRVAAEHVEAAIMEIDMLLTHAYALGKEDIVASWARSKIADSFTALTDRDKGDIGLSERWSVSTLLLLRGIGRLFPASDMRHPVCTPLALLLSEALELIRMKETKDVAMGILVSNILLEQMAESGRYSGQLTTFLIAVIEAAYGRRGGALAPAMKESREEGDVLVDETGSLRMTVSDCMKAMRTTDKKHALQGKIIYAALGMIEASGFSGRMKHIDIIYNRIPTELIPESELRNRLEQQRSASQQSRKPLAMYAKVTGVVAAKILNPKFSSEGGVFRKQARTSYVARRDGDVSASATRIRRALRKEERGFARDVRRSALQEAQNRAQIEAERAGRREKRGREAIAFLETQQANWKKAEKRQKMLSGKKW